MKNVLQRLTAALAMLVFCSAANAQQPTKMRLGFTGSAGFVSVMIAKDHGFFEKRGLDVEMVFMTKGSIIVPSILGGSLEAGTLTAPSLIRSVEAKMDLVILSATNVNSPSDTTSRLALRNGLTISNPKDLEGKKIGAAGIGGVLDTVFRQWALDRGVDPKKLTFLEVGFPQMGDMLKSGKIDAATVSEPFLSRLVESGSGQAGINYFADFPDGMLLGGFVVKRSWAEANRAAALAFREAVRDAVALLQKDPTVAYASLEKHLKLPSDVVKKLPRVKAVVDVTDEQLEFWNKLSKEQGLTRTLVDVKKLYFN